MKEKKEETPIIDLTEKLAHRLVHIPFDVLREAKKVVDEVLE